MTAANQPRSDVSFDLPGGESAAAALRRVEQERDTAEQEVIRVNTKRDELFAEYYEMRAERDAALAKRDQAIENGSHWTRETNLARAELVSAQTEVEVLRRTEAIELTRMRAELDTVRTARDNLARTLGAACRRITELETT